MRLLTHTRSKSDVCLPNEFLHVIKVTTHFTVEEQALQHPVNRALVSLFYCPLPGCSHILKIVFDFIERLDLPASLDILLPVSAEMSVVRAVDVSRRVGISRLCKLFCA